ncbi:MAG TPA: choice-of-anchor Q domain-containing protein, partial [Pirellulales bacterium]|nr:choice-of-anchor Q domain-containing protein [Pirellulales bacterium]
LSGNSTAGYHGDGAAIYTVYSGAAITLTNTTVTANANNGADANGPAVTAVRASITLTNSIVSGNSITKGTAPDVGFGNYSHSGTFIARHSLIGVNSGTPLAPAPVGSPDANGNLVGTFASPLDARLGPLADNGGQTQTHALLLGSPAINAGNNSLAVAANGGPLKNDQRGAGFARIFGGTVDMGSFEFHV